MLTLPALMPLTRAGYPATHDGQLHLYRLLAFDMSLRAGILYPRWVGEFAFGYGFPVFNFYGPGALYLAVGIKHLIGSGYVAAFKTTLGLSMVLAGWHMYWLARRLLAERTMVEVGALVAAVAYVYAPLHLVDIYVRGAISQVIAYGMLPLVFLCLHNVSHSNVLHRAPVRRAAWAWMLGGAAAFGLVIFTHNITAFLFAPLLGCYALIRGLQGVDRRGWARAAVMLGGGVGLTAIYWLPAVGELDLVLIDAAIGDGLHYSQHFINLVQPYQMQFFYDYTYDGRAFRLGLVQMLLLSTAVVVTVRHVHFWRTPRVFLAAVLVLAYLGQFPFAARLWETLPLAAYVQFPWRLLMVMALCGALLLGYAVADLNREEWVNRVAGLVGSGVILLLIVPMLLNLPAQNTVFERGQNWVQFGVWERMTRFIGTTSSGEFLPAGVDRLYLLQNRFVTRLPHDSNWLYGERDAAMVGKTRAEASVQTPEWVELDVEIPGAGCITLRHFYFPGWVATVNGQTIPLRATGKLGLMEVCLPAGRHALTLRFGDTPLRAWAWWISLASLGGLAVAASMDARHP